MQNVSSEWIDNQNSYNQKQGFVKIKIQTPNNGTVSISTLDETGKNLAQTIHQRGYDPMGLSLPYNDMQIELFNFEGELDFLYDKYEYSNLPVTVEYGYQLSKNETIPGGQFITSGIKKGDDRITIECVSTFELRSEDSIIARNSNDSEAVLYYTPGESKIGVTADDLQHQLTVIKGREVADGVIAAGVNIITTPAFDKHDILIDPDTAFTIANSVQYSANLLLQKAYINRADAVEFFDRSSPPIAIIKMINMYSKPKYSRSAPLKKVSVDTNQVNTTNTASVGINRRSGVTASDYGYSTSHKDLYLRNYIVDYTKSHIVRVYGAVVKVERKRLTVTEQQYVEEYGCSVVNMTNESARGFEVVLDSTDTSITVAPNIIPMHVESEIYNAAGMVCDINNPYGVPTNLDKIAAYFANRDICELDLRGNPALDVGDYIWLSLTDDSNAATYKKALVLESELTFDGTFKDKMKIRIIDNDFETLSGSTHADLSEHTHAELSNYTHKQLMTEAIQ